MVKFSAENRLRPAVKWAGGKSNLLDKMFPLFPTEFRRFVEPFVGGGAVFFSLQDDIPAVINDCNEELVNLYRVIRDEPFLLMQELDLLAREYSEEFYYTVRAQTSLLPVKKAARTVFLNKTGFNGLFRENSKGQFNVPWGKRTQCPSLYERENILAVSARLKGITVTSVDFESVLENCGAGDFVYCDPPYEPLSNTSSFTSYTAGGFSRDDQRRLKAACERAVERGAFVALSNSSAPFIKELYASFPTFVIKAKRAINSKGDARGEVDEILVTLGYDPRPEQKTKAVFKKMKRSKETALLLQT